MILFKIGNLDFTSYIDQQNYFVNRADVFKEWTDGRYRTHRDFLRTKISGSFAIGAYKPAVLAEIRNILENEKNAEGYYSAAVFVNNLNVVKNIQVYLDYTTDIKRSTMNGREWHTFAVTLEEL